MNEDATKSLDELLASMQAAQQEQFNQRIISDVMRDGELTIILRETLEAALKAAVGAAYRIHRAKLSLKPYARPGHSGSP